MPNAVDPVLTPMQEKVLFLIRFYGTRTQGTEKEAKELELRLYKIFRPTKNLVKPGSGRRSYVIERNDEAQ